MLRLFFTFRSASCTFVKTVDHGHLDVLEHGFWYELYVSSKYFSRLDSPTTTFVLLLSSLCTAAYFVVLRLHMCLLLGQSVVYYAVFRTSFFGDVVVDGTSCNALDVMLRYNPPNTNATAVHCMVENLCPKYKTLKRMVKNLRVVVMVVQARDEYHVMVKKIKICPIPTTPLRIKMAY